MPSRVFHAARSEAIARQGLLVDAFEMWCAALDLPTGLSGERMLENIREESHLTGDAGFGTHGRLADFLENCATSLPASGVHEECTQAYTESCSAFALSGTPISEDHLPPVLRRYIADARWLLEKLVDRFLGASEVLQFWDGMLTDHEAFQGIADGWDAGHVHDITLTRGKSVFATFETSSAPPRDDAVRVMNALALKPDPATPGRPIAVMELEYSTSAVNDYRFPTVADAGWHPLFRPAPDAKPDPNQPETLHGWTWGQNGEPSQPELVHGNAAMTIVTNPPRLVGTVDL